MIEESEDDDTYEPCPEPVADGDALIFDPVEFAEITRSLAVMVIGGALFVLDRETLKWVNVQDLRRPSNVRSIKTGQPPPEAAQ